MFEWKDASKENALPTIGTEVFVVTRDKLGKRIVENGYLVNTPGGHKWIHKNKQAVTHWAEIPKLPEE